MGIAISVSVGIPLLPLLIVSGATVQAVLFALGALIFLASLEGSGELVQEIQNKKVRKKRQADETQNENDLKIKDKMEYQNKCLVDTMY